MVNTDMNMSSDISPVKHTSGGEMPDTSRIGQVGRRLRSAMPMMSTEQGLRTTWVPLVLLGVGIGAFLFWRNNRGMGSQTIDTRSV